MNDILIGKMGSCSKYHWEIANLRRILFKACIETFEMFAKFDESRKSTKKYEENTSEY